MRKIFTVIFLIIGVFFQPTMAKDPGDSTNFIGPLDYRVPPPLSREEILAREIEALLQTEIEIPKMLQKQDYLTQWKYTGDSQFTLAREIGERQSVEGWLLMEIDHSERVGNRDQMGDMQHLLAWEYFRLGQTETAFSYFEKALATKTALNKTADVITIHYNLAALYEFANQLRPAQQSYQKILDYAVHNREKSTQGYATLRLALIKAKNGAFHEAEQDIIQKVLPLYKGIRGSEGDLGRILAYYVLAEVYTIQNRYPEAQWFLLQSRELAREKNHPEWMPSIIFGLAETKNSSGNRSVALEEYKEADQLAKQSNLLVMQLAIQEALGALYHEFGDYKEAMEALNRFDTIKNQLLLHDFLF